MFFTLDGVDGAGKSTQIKLFADWLREQGCDVVQCRDPGSTQLGEKLRGLLLDHHDVPFGMRSEMLIYMAARAQLVEEVIKPALAAGKAVISDRFLLANVVYQGYAGGLSVEELWQVGRVATAGVEPAKTFVLDIDPAVAAARQGRAPDRMEQRGLSFLTRVREGFLAESKRRPEQIIVIDAARSVDAVQAEIRSEALKSL